MKLKNNPFTLLQNLKKCKSNKKPKTPPKFLSALSLFPPAARPLNSCDPIVTGAFIPPHHIHNLNQSRLDAENNVRPLARRKPSPHTKPFEIVYPEDDLRQAFYKKHVNELFRPACAVEDDISMAKRDWSDINGGSSPVPLSGESVIKHAMYLMSAEGGSKNRVDAYALSLSAFYKRAAEVETSNTQYKEKMILEMNRKVEENEKISMPDKPWTEAFMREEERELEQGMQYTIDQNIKMNARKSAESQMNHFTKNQSKSTAATR